MNLQEFLQEHGVKYWQTGEHSSVRSGWIGTVCPQCKKPYLGFRGRSASCWYCGPMRIGEVLQQLTGLSIREIYQHLGTFETPIIPIKKARGKLQVPKGIGPLLPIHQNYLKERGFDPAELTRLWNLQGIGMASRLAWRIFIPIMENGETESWTTRATAEQTKVRYISASPDQERQSIKSLLLGMDYVRHCAIVCEGPFDVFRIGPGAVCTFGTNWSNAQIAKLVQVPVRAVCFDTEPKAQQRAEELSAALSAFPGRTVRVELDAKDPGSATAKEVSKLRKAFLKEG